MEPDGLPTPAEVEAALASVYARPEFTDRELPFLLRWIRDLYRAAEQALLGLLQELVALEATRPVLFWILAAWLALTLGAILVHLGTSAWYALRGKERRPRGEERARRPQVGAVDWAALARRAAEGGRFRDASVALYRELLTFLRDRGTVRIRDSKTPHEYLGEARRGDPGRAVPFAAFLRLFEPMAFGRVAPDASEFVRLEDAAREVKGG